MQTNTVVVVFVYSLHNVMHNVTDVTTIYYSSIVELILGYPGRSIYPR